MTLAGLAGGLLHLFLVGPTYAATAQILVSPVPEQPGLEGTSVLVSSSDMARTLQTAVGLIDTRAAAARTGQRLGGSWRPDSVDKHTRVELTGQSNIIAVEGTGTNAREAAALANTFARSALDARNDEVKKLAATRLGYLRLSLRTTPDPSADMQSEASALSMMEQKGDPSLTLAQEAQIPPRSTGLPPAASVGVATALGLVLGLALAFLRSLRDPRIVDRREIAELPWPTLAALSTRGLAPPHDGMDGRQFRVVSTLLSQVPHGLGAILVTNATAGDGRSFVAHGLAKAEVDAGNSVLLLGCDHSIASDHWEPEPLVRDPSLAVAVGAGVVGRGVAPAWLALHGPNGKLAEVPEVSPGTMAQNSCLNVPRRELPMVMQEARRKATRVIVDTGPLAEAELALAVVPHVDQVVVVLHQGHTRRDDVQTLRELLSGMGQHAVGVIVLTDEAPRSGSDRYPDASS